MIISRTPVRISLFGGGTDYPAYYREHGGAVLGGTIDKYVYVSINRLSKFFEYKIRIGYSKAELVNTVDEIAHPSVRECLRFMKIDGNLDIHIFADLPARTGLGSSSAFTVGFLHALYALEGRIVSKDQLARDALYVEQEMIREHVGSQDQIHAAFGGLNLVAFGESGFKVQPLIISPDRRRRLEDSLLVFYTGQVRLATEILKEQVERTSSKLNDLFLVQMRAAVDEAVAIIAQEAPDRMVERLGALLHRNWALKKSLSTQVSNPLIDGAYEAAMAAGAFGGKIAGAGGGGFLFVLADPAKHAAIRAALGKLLEVEVRFEDEGSSIIYLKS